MLSVPEQAARPNTWKSTRLPLTRDGSMKAHATQYLLASQCLSGCEHERANLIQQMYRGTPFINCMGARHLHLVPYSVQQGLSNSPTRGFSCMSAARTCSMDCRDARIPHHQGGIWLQCWISESSQAPLCHTSNAHQVPRSSSAFRNTCRL